MARGSSGQGSRISKMKGLPRKALAKSAGNATVSGVEDAMIRSGFTRKARRVAAAA